MSPSPSPFIKDPMDTPQLAVGYVTPGKGEGLNTGRFLWARTIGSTIIGESLDTAIFSVFAFMGTPLFVPVIVLHHWLVKVGIGDSGYTFYPRYCKMVEEEGYDRCF